MASRVMISPVVENPANVFRAKAEQYCDKGFVNYFPSGADGRATTTFVMTLGRATDWTTANADAQIEFLFPIPNTVDTADDLRAWLQTHTVANLTTAQRTAMQAIFDNHGIPRADFTLTTTAAQVLQRVASFLFERDAGFGLGFSF